MSGAATFLGLGFVAWTFLKGRTASYWSLAAAPRAALAPQAPSPAPQPTMPGSSTGPATPSSTSTGFVPLLPGESQSAQGFGLDEAATFGGLPPSISAPGALGVHALGGVP